MKVSSRLQLIVNREFARNRFLRRALSVAVPRLMPAKHRLLGVPRASGGERSYRGPGSPLPQRDPLIEIELGNRLHQPIGVTLPDRLAQGRAARRGQFERRHLLDQVEQDLPGSPRRRQ